LFTDVSRQPNNLILGGQAAQEPLDPYKWSDMISKTSTSRKVLGKQRLQYI